MNKMGNALMGAFVCVLIIVGLYYFSGQTQKEEDITASAQQGDSVQEAQEEAFPEAVLVYSEGTVEYLGEDLKWREMKDGAHVVEGDSIRISGDGKAVLMFEDGSVARLNGNTEINIDALQSDHIALSNAQGDLYTRVVKSQDRMFDVDVDGNIYRAEGTAYRTLNKKEKKGLVVYESSVKVIKNKEDSDDKEVVVKEGQAYFDEEVVDVELERLGDDEFILWNKQEDEKTEEFKENLGILKDVEEVEDSSDNDRDTKDTATQVQKTVSQIQLYGKQVSDGAYLSWTVSGVDAPKGFKIVKSTEANPVYPGNDYQYFSDPGVRSYKWKLQDGKTYYFRVCQYLGGECGVYSNNIKVAIPVKSVSQTTAESGSVSSILLAFAGGSSVSWSVNGVSEKGFKVVWSKNSEPTYPIRSGDQYIYLSDKNARSTALKPFNGSGTYYVRVCEYLGGACGKYSNQIVVEL